MHIERLLLWADYLDQLNPDFWDFSNIVSHCGTVGCAIGHLPNVFPEHFRYDVEENDIATGDDFSWESYINFFEMPIEDFNEIFDVCNKRHVYGASLVTSTMVADKIRQYVSTGEVQYVVEACEKD